jgi:peptidoglycan/xylan/chitin deacetylase (PgdA/CDA1 family)
MRHAGALAESVVGSALIRSLLRLPLWRGALILGYHRILKSEADTAFDPGVVSATPAGLDAQLQLITRHFDVVSPNVLEESRTAGRRVVLTFDDGYRDNYELAFPVLRRYGVPATFFLATGFLDRPRVPWWDELAWMARTSPRQVLGGGAWLRRPIPLEGDRRGAVDELVRTFKALPTTRTRGFLDFCGDAAGTGRCADSAGANLWMTWQMAAELRDAGMVIGGHTATHPVLARADEGTQRREIEECRRRLREELGAPMRYFAYPVGLPGSFDDTTQRILRRAGVRLAFSLHGGYLRPRRLDPYDVPRASVGITSDPSALRAALALPRLFARW